MLRSKGQRSRSLQEPYSAHPIVVNFFVSGCYVHCNNVKLAHYLLVGSTDTEGILCSIH